MELLLPSYRTLHCPLLSFMRFLSAHFSACPSPSEWQGNHLVPQSHLFALYPLQNCRVITLSCCPGQEWRALLAPSLTPGDTMSNWPPAGLPAVHHDSSRPGQTVLWIILLFERHHIFSKADDKCVSPFCTRTWQLLSQGNATNYSAVDISNASH